MWTKPRRSKKFYTSPGRRRRRRFSLPIFIGVIIVLTIALIGVGSFVVIPRFLRSYASAATTPNPDCTITLPSNPLSAQGLATPYQLGATDPAA
ncbi:MAG TPA: hypothetical protein VFA15_02335, partial [Nitrososphaera sp.]|nr:hypothetical protein [Nitrososphaera sp.]